jgi:hypothetical protein
MSKTVTDLRIALGVSRPDLVRFGECYNIDLSSFCIKPQPYLETIWKSMMKLLTFSKEG